jgi:23S rRNA pseudouridine1911/1915/1917 synthase
MQEKKEILVPKKYAHIRLDQALASLFPSYSRASMQQHIEGGRVFVNGHAQKKRYLVEEGDLLTLCLLPPEPSLLIPENMSFSVLFEDTDLFAINKPPHLVVHPAPGNKSGTFVHGFLAHLQNSAFDDPVRPGIIHRLDKDTSGVLLAAKNREALYAVSKQFHDRKVGKEYFAVVVGEFTGYSDVQGFIARDSRNRKRMAVSESGKHARTEVFGVQARNGFSLIRAIPHTGRTHQVRVHLRSLGLSILGDDLYGQKEINKKWGVRQMLHCFSLTFCHPRTHETLRLEAPFFADMKAVFERLGFYTSSW